MSDRSRPLAQDVAAIAARTDAVAVVLHSGVVRTWGAGGQGSHRLEDAAGVAIGRHELVVRTHAGRLVSVPSAGGPPAAVPGVGTAVQVLAGDDFFAALTVDGRVLTWGANSCGQLGSGDRVPRREPEPVAFPGVRPVVTHLWAGRCFVVAATSDRRVFTWGGTRQGQSGHGDTGVDLLRPHRVAVLDGALVSGVHGGPAQVVLSCHRGPAEALRLEPRSSVVQPGEAVTFAVRRCDVFGSDLGAMTGRGLTLTVNGVTTAGPIVRFDHAGHHLVTARAGALTGTASVTVASTR